MFIDDNISHTIIIMIYDVHNTTIYLGVYTYYILVRSVQATWLHVSRMMISTGDVAVYHETYVIKVCVCVCVGAKRPVSCGKNYAPDSAVVSR